MKAIWIPKHGAPDVLEVRESEDPQPGAGEVRVRVRACGLNFAEVMARQGLYPDAPKPPMVVGYEVAGEIDAVGDGVPGDRVGKRVLAMIRFGGHADTVCVGDEQYFEMPASMSFEEGAALPVNYLTAYHMLFEVFRVRSGDHVLIHMAAGGVGTAVCQLCRGIEGVTTYGTASAKKHDYVRGHGCDHVIDYRSVDYVNAIHELTAGKGVDLVMDPLGGNDWKKGYSILRPAGMLIAFGWANMSVGNKRKLGRIIGELTSIPFYTPGKLMNDNKGVAGVNMGHMWDEVELLRREMDALVKLYTAGKIKPHVDQVFSFEQAAEAHRYLEQGKNVGKVVFKP